MLGIIAGSGLSKLQHLTQVRRELIRTPFGEPSCAVTLGQWAGVEVAFINRHGYGHTLAPHQINYRANLWALQHLGVQAVCAIGSVGSMRKDLEPGCLVVPHDVLDYTQGRKNTYCEGPHSAIVYTDMSEPFDGAIRAHVLQACQTQGISPIEKAVYACTNGPRLETCAEVVRMTRDGADVVGMSLVPEVILAKELGLPYAAIGVCTHYAAGVGSAGTHDLTEWERLREHALTQVETVLAGWLVSYTQITAATSVA